MEEALSLWSGILVELAGLVLHRLHAHVDRVRFAAVCRQWRFAAQQVPLPPPLPLLALKDRSGTFYSMPGGEPLQFPVCYGGFVTASGKWLVYNRSHFVLLVDPFSGATMTLPAAPIIYDRYDEEYDEVDYMNLVKLIVCSPHLIAALFEDGFGCWVAVYRPGASSWSVAQELHTWIFYIAFYKEKLYAVNYAQGLLALDISVDDNSSDPQVTRIRKVISGGWITHNINFQQVLYLIESCGSLLTVRRRIFNGHIHDKGQIHTFAEQSEPELAVFEADFGQARWTKVMTLRDDQALFLGPCSRAVCMPECHSQEKRVWLLDGYEKDGYKSSSRSDPNDIAIRKFSRPLPMISWTNHKRCAGAVWLFPSN